MAVRSFDSADGRVQGVLQITRQGPRPAAEWALRQRLVVVAPGAVSAVRHVGGWVFDRVMAGWDATVLVAGRCDSRPLRILGADTGDLESALASPGPRPQLMAVEAGLYGADARVRRIVREAFDEGGTEVRLWDDTWPAGADRGGGHVQHRLSVAARAFKAQALAAAAAPTEAMPGTETFRSGLVSAS